MVRIQIKSTILSIWVQTVCKDDQQMTKSPVADEEVKFLGEAMCRLISTFYMCMTPKAKHRLSFFREKDNEEISNLKYEYRFIIKV